MNSNSAAPVRITPFRVFDAQLRNSYKRRLAEKIQGSLQQIGLDADHDPAISADEALARKLLQKQLL